MGLVVGAVAASFAVVARRAFALPATIPDFVRRVVWLPVDVAVDAADLTRLLVTGRAFSSDCGSVDELDLPDDDSVRAWAVLLVSASPGSLAADVEERDDRLVVRRHRITRSGRTTSELGQP